MASGSLFKMPPPPSPEGYVESNAVSRHRNVGERQGCAVDDATAISDTTAVRDGEAESVTMPLLTVNTVLDPPPFTVVDEAPAPAMVSELRDEAVMVSFSV